MNHIDVVFLINSERLTGIKISHAAIAEAMSAEYPARFYSSDIKHMIDVEPMPTKQQWCHYLKNMGFSQKKISEFLNIQQPAVSYHLGRPVKKQYTNPHIIGVLEDDKRTRKSESVVF